MPRPRRLASSTSLSRSSLSRLSSSSSSSSGRKSNSKIYIFLITGGLLLLASVAFLQIHLLKAPHGFKLSPLEKDKSDKSIAKEQGSWWRSDSSREVDATNPDLQFGDENLVESQKLGRRMGTLQGGEEGEEDEEAEDAEGGDEDMETGEESGDDEEEEEDEEQDSLDVDIDDREAEPDTDKLEELDMGDMEEKSISVQELSKEDMDSEGQGVDDLDKLPSGQGMGKASNLATSEERLLETKTTSAEGGTDVIWGDRNSSTAIVEHGISLGGERSDGDGRIGDKGDKRNGSRGGRVQEDLERKPKRFEKLGNILTVPKWVLENNVVGKISGHGDKGLDELLERATQGDPLQNWDKQKGSLFWDHTLGVRKRAVEVDNKESKLGLSGGVANLANLVLSHGKTGKLNLVAGDGGAAKVAMQQLRGFKEFVESWKERFNSDDEPVDENVQRRLEDVKEIEDALLLNGDGATFKQSAKAPSKKTVNQSKNVRSASDPMNPANIPMLQDPDTSPGTWMTKSDRAMLRAMRVDNFGSDSLPSKMLRGNAPKDPKLSTNREIDFGSQRVPAKAVNDKSDLNQDPESHRESFQLNKDSQEELAKLSSEEGVLDVGALQTRQESGSERSGAPLLLKSSRVLQPERMSFGKVESTGPGDDRTVGEKVNHLDFKTAIKDVSSNAQGLSLSEQRTDEGSMKHWGYYPGINSTFPFSTFMDRFLGQQSCTLKVFMAWTTPSWSFTARHQRTLESLFRLNRNACVAVFSETIGPDSIKGFVQEGYKVAVVRPNLEELLADTPLDVFTSVWGKWRKVPLFHLHCTELLRLAALYKYGGVYMDMDVIVLKPLDSLHNTVGSEAAANGELRLNGALLAFNKSSLFLKKCMEEFTATYDDTRPEWNGADLLTRVANSPIKEAGKTWKDLPDMLHIEDPFSIFPLSSRSISKYFAAPKDSRQNAEHRELRSRIVKEAYAVHLWSRLTSNLVPEVDSLVGTILSGSCLHCTSL